MRLISTGCMLVLALGVTACGPSNLHSLKKPGEGPDEFLIVPGKPLQEPADYAALPQPTPGGVNLTDQTPVADGAAALGGRRSTTVTGAIPASDGSLVNQASRFGRDPAIRSTLSVEDEAYRKRRGRFTRLRFPGVDVYARVYEPLSLDPAREAARWRRAGARTPSAPTE